MSDINLLPDELRKKEETERQTAPKPTPPPFTWRQPTLSKGVTPVRGTPPPPKSAPQKPLPSPQSKPSAPLAPSFLSTMRTWFSRERKGVVPQPERVTTLVPAAPRREAGIDVNLLTRGDNGVEKPVASFFHIATTSAIVLGITITLLIGGWLLIRKTADERALRTEELDRTVVTLRKELTEVQQSMAAMMNLGNRLRQAKLLLNGHPYTGKFIEFLERETYGKIQLTNVSIRPEENRVSVEVVALDIPAVVGQLLHWMSARETIVSIGVTSVSRQERPEFSSPMYTFDVTLDLVPTVFHPPLTAK